MEFSSGTKLYAVIGDPIEHSLSPIMQNAVFQSLGLDNVYLAFRVKTEDLECAIGGMRSLGIAGFNVTVPHKVSVIRYLDRVNQLAIDIGAVNTVFNDGGVLIGYNTDGEGALAALNDEGVELEGRKVVLLGAGGAAKAISHSVAPTVAKLIILNRTESKAKELVSSFKSRLYSTIEGGKLTTASLRGELADTDILINATSVGMFPKTEETPVEKKFLHRGMTVFDIVYNPLKTRLLKDAENVGAHTIGGVKMLVYQGALAFELWTGKKPPVGEMCKVVENALRRRIA